MVEHPVGGVARQPGTLVLHHDFDPADLGRESHIRRRVTRGVESDVRQQVRKRLPEAITLTNDKGFIGGTVEFDEPSRFDRPGIGYNVFNDLTDIDG